MVPCSQQRVVPGSWLAPALLVEYNPGPPFSSCRGDESRVGIVTWRGTPRMDSRHFDALARVISGEGGSRREALRLVIGGGLAALLGSVAGDDTEAGPNARARRRRRHKNKKKKKPAPAPAPAATCAGTNIVCNTNQPSGCCSQKCCFDTTSSTSGVCASGGGTCCSARQEGGYCPQGFPQCCGNNNCCRGTE